MIVKDIDTLIDLFAFGDIYEVPFYFEDQEPPGYPAVQIPLRSPEEGERPSEEEITQMNTLAVLIAFKEGKLNTNGHLVT